MPRKRSLARKKRPLNPAEYLPIPTTTSEAGTSVHDDGEMPHQIHHLSDIVVDLQDRLPRLFDEITAELANCGVTVRGVLSDMFHPDAIDLSAIDPKTARIAMLMFRLGIISTDQYWMANERNRLLPVLTKSKAGTEAINTQSKATHSIIRRAFADLADSNTPNSDVQIAKQLAFTLAPTGVGFSEGSIRRQIVAMRKEIIAISKKRCFSALSPSDKIYEIIRQSAGSPGVSFETVRYFLHRPK